MIPITKSEVCFKAYFSTLSSDASFADDFILVKRTYAIQPSGLTTSLNQEDQTNIGAEINYDDEVGKSLRLPEDYLPPLEKVDFIVLANAYAPDGVAIQRMQCEVQIQGYKKIITVVGDRTYKSFSDGTSELSTPKPFESMPLRAELAFGGLGFKENPYGKGYIYSLSNDPIEAILQKAFEDMPPTDPTETGELPPEKYLNEEDHLDDLAKLEAFPAASSQTISENEVALSYALEAPNLEYPDNPFLNPDNQIKIAGFFCSPTGWSQRLATTEGAKLQAEILNEEPADIEDDEQELFDLSSSSTFSYALEDQRIDQIPEKSVMKFVNMVQDRDVFNVTFPSQYPRIYISKRGKNLSLKEYKMRQNTVIVDLLEMKLTVVWKCRMKLEGVNALQKDWNYKYAYLFFEEEGEKRPQSEIDKDFESSIQEYEFAEKVFGPLPNEGYQEKLAEIKDTLTNLGKDAEIDDEVLNTFSNLESEDQLENFFEKALKQAQKDHELAVEKLKKFADEKLGS